jgi:ankyrin repeat protein
MDKPLVNAVDKGDEEAVKALLAAGYEHLEEREDRFGNTAFILAASHGHQSILQALLAAGANKDAQAHDGFTALIAAIGNSHGGSKMPTVQALLDAHVDMDAKTNVSRCMSRWPHDATNLT